MGQQKPIIKVCGVVSQGDAELAAQAGADYVGMILWPKARRSVTLETAAQIAAAAKDNGAKPVGVFVDEDFADIVRWCKAAGVETAQLHGKGARAALQDLPQWLEVGTLFAYAFLSGISGLGALETMGHFTSITSRPICCILMIADQAKWRLPCCNMTNCAIATLSQWSLVTSRARTLCRQILLLTR